MLIVIYCKLFSRKLLPESVKENLQAPSYQWHADCHRVQTGRYLPYRSSWGRRSRWSLPSSAPDSCSSRQQRFPHPAKSHHVGTDGLALCSFLQTVKTQIHYPGWQQKEDNENLDHTIKSYWVLRKHPSLMPRGYFDSGNQILSSVKFLCQSRQVLLFYLKSLYRL